MPGVRSPSRRARCRTRTGRFARREALHAPARETCRRSSRPPRQGDVSASSVISVDRNEASAISPAWLRPWTVLARPKSRTLACPLSVTNMLAGLMSRCTIPLACAACNASAICTASRRSSPVARGRLSMCCFSVLPSSSSVVMKSRPVDLVDVVDGADVRVVQCRGRPRLAPEAFEGVGCLRQDPRGGTSAPRPGRVSCPRRGRRRPCHRFRSAPRCGSGREFGQSPREAPCAERPY